MITEEVQKMGISILYFILVAAFVTQTVLNVKNSKGDNKRKDALLSKQLETYQAQREYFEARRDNYIFEDVTKDEQA